MKHLTCLCTGTLLACLIFGNAQASTPQSPFSQKPDLSVSTDFAQPENRFLAERDEEVRRSSEYYELQRREKMHRANDRYQKEKMRREQERMIREQRRMERERAHRDGQHWDNRYHEKKRHDKDRWEKERKRHERERWEHKRDQHRYHRPPRHYDDGKYHPGR